jgi:hypothetical protein
MGFRDRLQCEIYYNKFFLSFSKEKKDFNFFFNFQSVSKTGRLMITHEANMTMGFGAEIAAYVQV